MKPSKYNYDIIPGFKFPEPIVESPLDKSMDSEDLER